MEITVHVKAPDLAQALLAVAQAFGGQFHQAVAQQTGVPLSPTGAAAQQEFIQTNYPQNVPTTAQQTPYQPAPQVPQMQQSQYAPPGGQPLAPMQQPPLTAVPTVAPQYNFNQLAVAATQLVDAGRRDHVTQLLASYGVEGLMELPKEHYGTFATALRAMGAQL